MKIKARLSNGKTLTFLKQAGYTSITSDKGYVPECFMKGLPEHVLEIFRDVMRSQNVTMIIQRHVKPFTQEELHSITETLTRFFPGCKPVDDICKEWTEPFPQEGDFHEVGSISFHYTLVKWYDGTYGVHLVTVRSGCHTLRNGDPGYPDEYDYREMIEPTYDMGNALREFILLEFKCRVESYFEFTVEGEWSEINQKEG